MKGFLTWVVLLLSVSATFLSSSPSYAGPSLRNLSTIELSNVLSAITLAPDLVSAKSDVETLEGFHEFRTELIRLSSDFDDLDEFRQNLICDGFRKLTEEDIFEVGDFFVHGYENKDESSCAQDFISQLNKVWKQKEQELENVYGKLSSEQHGVGSADDENIEMIDYDVPDGSYLDGVNRFGHPLPEGYFALTFDDGPHPTRTERVLKTLENYQVQATFFMVGHNADKYKDIAQRVRNAGHSIGSHSFNHPNMRRMPYEAAYDNIVRGHDFVTNAVLEDSYPFFRFPFGNHTEDLRVALKQEPLSEFFWNVDTRDWDTKDPIQLVENVLEMLERQKRGIILFHDIQEQTALALPYILEEMKKRGLKLVLYHPVED